MKTHHWIVLIVVLGIGYFAGIKWPGVGTSALGKVGL